MAGDASEAIRAIDDLIERLESATEAATREGIGVFEGAAKSNAPIKTGTLRRSIFVTGPIRTAMYRWTARVGPTVVYSRIRELGGVIRAKHLTADGRPGFLRWVDAAGRPHFAREVTQRGTHYVKRGVEETASRVRAIFYEHWLEAIGR